MSRELPAMRGNSPDRDFDIGVIGFYIPRIESLIDALLRGAGQSRKDQVPPIQEAFCCPLRQSLGAMMRLGLRSLARSMRARSWSSGGGGKPVLRAVVFGLHRSLTRGRMLIRLRPAAPPDVVDRAHMPHPSRFASFARDELPC